MNTYVKRFQMVYDLRNRPLIEPVLPDHFVWIPWSQGVLKTHATVLYLSFRGNIDGKIFPSFGSLDRCRNLMDALSSRQGFLPGTTWLMSQNLPHSPPEYCATIQGIQHSSDVGSIQNVAVLPEFRRRGLGAALVQKALLGFQQAGIERVGLEVTAENCSALRLYKKNGFDILKTIYKEVVR